MFFSSLHLHCLKLAADQLIPDQSSSLYQRFFRSNLGVSLKLLQLMTGSDAHENILRPFDSYVIYTLVVVYVVVVRFGLLATAVGVIVLNVLKNEKRRA